MPSDLQTKTVEKSPQPLDYGAGGAGSGPSTRSHGSHGRIPFHIKTLVSLSVPEREILMTALGVKLNHHPSSWHWHGWQLWIPVHHPSVLESTCRVACSCPSSGGCDVPGVSRFTNRLPLKPAPDLSHRDPKKILARSRPAIGQVGRGNSDGPNPNVAFVRPTEPRVQCSLPTCRVGIAAGAFVVSAR